jgi:hypothetical protein
MAPSSKSGRVMKAITVGPDGEPEHEWTRQIPDDPFSTSYQHQGIQEPPFDMEQLALLADQHPTHAAILEQKAADVVGNGWEWKTVDEEQEANTKQRDELEEWFNGLADDSESDDTTHEILLSAWDDLETFGQGFIELARDTKGELAHWFRAPAHTFRFSRDGIKILQKRGNRKRWYKKWIPGDERVVDEATGEIYDTRKQIKDGHRAANELFVLKRPSRKSSWYGTPKYISAVGVITLSLAARDDNILFFRNRREPRWLIVLENVENDPELQDEILEALRSELRSPHRNLVLPLSGPAKATFQKIGADQNDSSWEKLQDRCDASILLAHRMPGERVGAVRSGPLGGNAVTAATQVYKDGFVTTSQSILSARINRLIAKECKAAGEKPSWKWQPVELDLTERDAELDSAVRAYQGGVITLDEAREKLGEEKLPEEDERGKKFFTEIKGAAPVPGALPPDDSVLQGSNEQVAARIEELLAGDQ